MRFNELQKSINDISLNILTETLRKFESDERVNRNAYPKIPPRGESNLRDRGNSLLPHIHCLSDWAKSNIEGIKKIPGGIN